MSWVYGHQWAQAASAQRHELAQALQYHQQLEHQHKQRRAELARQLSHAMEELTATLLPRLDPAVLAHAAALTGYTPLVQPSVLQTVEQERQWMTARVAQIEAAPSFIHREHLRDPRGGKLVLELAELTDAQKSVREVFLLCDHPRMWHLIQVGYGTPEYAVPFWRLSYYTDWEAGDLIVERFPGKTFAEVREKFLEAQQADKSLQQRIDELRTEIAQGEPLDREHAQCRESLATLEQRHLQRARTHLARHLVDSGAQAVGPRLAQAPEVDVLAKRLFGLAAKLTYFDGLGQAQLFKTRQELEEGIARAERESYKYGRPKKSHMAIPEEAFQKRFRPRGERYRKGWQRYQRASDTVYVFDRYDRGSWAADFLWWDVMTDGRIDGDFLPEVAYHRQHFPHYQYDRDAWDQDPHHAALSPDPDPHDSPDDQDAGVFDPS